MSEITNDGLTRSSTGGYFIAYGIAYTYGKGLATKTQYKNIEKGVHCTQCDS